MPYPDLQFWLYILICSTHSCVFLVSFYRDWRSVGLLYIMQWDREIMWNILSVRESYPFPSSIPIQRHIEQVTESFWVIITLGAAS
jgi:hypothetical protein